jgi:hypothetical protein
MVLNSLQRGTMRRFRRVDHWSVESVSFSLSKPFFRAASRLRAASSPLADWCRNDLPRLLHSVASRSSRALHELQQYVG